jgi:hypothetical protein
MTDFTSHSKIERFQGFPGLNSVVNPYLSLCRHALSWVSKVHSITGQVILEFFFFFFYDPVIDSQSQEEICRLPQPVY